MTAVLGCQDTLLAQDAARLARRRQAVQPDRVAVSFARQNRAAGQPIPDCDARRVEEMRRIASAQLRYWGLYELTEPAALVVSELVTNAIEHGQGEAIGFSIAYAHDTVRIAVTDGSPNRPQKQRLDPLSDGGRGLILIEWTASEHGGEWGASADGTATWCTLAASLELPSDQGGPG